MPLNTILLSVLLSIHSTDTRSLIHAAIPTTRPILALALLRRPLLIPLPIRQQIIQPKAQQRKLVPLQILRVLRTQVHSRGDARHDGDFVRVDERPCGRKARALLALEEHHPGHDEDVVRPRVAELMPPVFADDLAFVDLIDAPEMAVAVFVQIDSLENVFVEIHLRRELALVVRAVEAHFQLRSVLVVHFDVVHRLEVLFGVFVARALVNVGELGDGFGGVVEVLVMVFHVFRVPVRDGDVVGELGGAEDFTFAVGGGGFEDAFGCVRAGRC